VRERLILAYSDAAGKPRPAESFRPERGKELDGSFARKDPVDASVWG